MRTGTWARVVGLALVVICGGTLVVAQAPSPAEEQSANPLSGPYRVGVEDLLEVLVWDEPDLSRTVTVRPDGMITVPLIGDVKAAGLTTDEIREQLATALARLVREPNVTVIVQEIRSYRVFVLGEVNLQGVLEFRRPTRLLQALASAGGLTTYSKKQVTVVRELHGRQVRIEVDLKPLLGGVSQDNLLLEPGDTLLVN